MAEVFVEYEFRLDKKRELQLYQQGTYAPDKVLSLAGQSGDRSKRQHWNRLFLWWFAKLRWSTLRRANGQRSERTTDSSGKRSWLMGEGSQNVMRWQDYTQTAIDPSDDCTIWYVGDYLKKDAPFYSSRIGAFRLPGCKVMIL